MKKSQLRQLIREEISKVLTESNNVSEIGMFHDPIGYKKSESKGKYKSSEYGNLPKEKLKENIHTHPRFGRITDNPQTNIKTPKDGGYSPIEYSYNLAKRKYRFQIDTLSDDKLELFLKQKGINPHAIEKLLQDRENSLNENYMISKSGSKKNPLYVIEKTDGSEQIDMFFDSEEEAKKYATKKGLKLTKKGYNLKENIHTHLKSLNELKRRKQNTKPIKEGSSSSGAELALHYAGDFGEYLDTRSVKFKDGEEIWSLQFTLNVPTSEQYTEDELEKHFYHYSGGNPGGYFFTMKSSAYAQGDVVKVKVSARGGLDI